MGIILASATPAVPVVPATPVLVTGSAASVNRSLATAVRDLNDVNYAGSGREVNLSIDRVTRQPVITVIDAETRKVITQWPPQYLLDVAAEINSLLNKQEQDSR